MNIQNILSTMNAIKNENTISTIKEETSFKLVEKKSTFVAYIFKISKEEEIKEKLQAVKKNHKDASHFPYAVRLTRVHNRSNEPLIETIERYSDDGEPNKTAGYPIFKLLQNLELSNILIIVARTFGGIKLGPAGLMKAFSGVVQEALNKTVVKTTQITIEEIIHTDIYHLSKIEIYLKQQGLKYEKEFNDSQIIVKIKIPFSQQKLIEEINYLK